MPVLRSSIYRDTPYWLNFVFAGQAYSASHVYTIGAGATAYLELKTDARIAHILSFTGQAEGAGPILVGVRENPTAISGTTPPTAIANMDRRSAKTPSMQVFVNPTGISGGTVIETFLIATGGGPKSAGSLAAEALEWILRPAARYVLSLLNQGSQSSSCHVSLLWCESDN